MANMLKNYKKNKIAIWFLAIILWQSSFALAAKFSCEKNLNPSLLEIAENKDSFYVQFQCSSNMARVVKHLAAFPSTNFHLQKANVLILAPQQGDRVLFPFGASQAPANGWAFHVVLEYEGRILDLDAKDPKMMPVAWSYFQNMFGVKMDSPFDLRIFSIPAVEYLTKYELGQCHDYYLYPQKSTKDFFRAYQFAR